MKKYLLLVACALMASFTVKAAKAGGDCGDGGDPVYWSLSDDGTTLTITGEGWCIDIDDADESPWYQYRADITTVNIGAGVEWIEGIVFAGCNKLTTITVDAKNPKMKVKDGCVLVYDTTEVGTDLYTQCTLEAYASGLTGQLVVPEDVTDINEQACYGCSMSSIKVTGTPRFNYQCFGGCTNLTSVYFLNTTKLLGTGPSFEGSTANCILYVQESLLDYYKEQCRYAGFKDIVAYQVPTGINDVNAARASKARKFVQDGQIVIEKDGKQYNVAGMELK